jgi:membrane protein implicated in regulation of membrane protease activity
MFDRVRLIAGGAVLAALGPATAAFAQEAQTPSISGNAWIAIAIVAVLVVVVVLLISGVISVSKRDTEEGDGFPVIEDEEDRPKRRR